MTDITKALVSLRPGAEWVLDGDQYEGLVWLDLDQTPPTKEEVEAEVLRLQAEWNALEYRRLRASAYPPIGDQLDALWKGGDVAAEMLARVQAVKAQYPKPEGV